METFLLGPGSGLVGSGAALMGRCEALNPLCENNHTHEHIGTVGMATKHSKTSVNRPMMTESAASKFFSELISSRRVLVVERRSRLASVLLLLLFFFFSHSFQSLFLYVSKSEQRRVAGTSILSSSALQNGFQLMFSLCCDQAIKTPGSRGQGSHNVEAYKDRYQRQHGPAPVATWTGTSGNMDQYQRQHGPAPAASSSHTSGSCEADQRTNTEL
ncbi:uncharacterized protein LOC119018670 isoform X2 [Acanthopagrus latus]|uniref:uncharacterized protein LOC119018670 isoform X2 n=1 Tax=Acanthopagrus latus TaxID=8177 RepID=UPI00187D0B5B|nr:uncharacterized protein LOC119018670 isoform X2 [Acanthopagrus latus]